MVDQKEEELAAKGIRRREWTGIWDPSPGVNSQIQILVTSFQISSTDMLRHVQPDCEHTSEQMALGLNGSRQY